MGREWMVIRWFVCCLLGRERGGGLSLATPNGVRMHILDALLEGTVFAVGGYIVVDFKCCDKRRHQKGGRGIYGGHGLTNCNPGDLCVPRCLIHRAKHDVHLNQRKEKKRKKKSFSNCWVEAEGCACAYLLQTTSLGFREEQGE